jgi:hypothetical protein
VGRSYTARGKIRRNDLTVVSAMLRNNPSGRDVALQRISGDGVCDRSRDPRHRRTAKSITIGHGDPRSTDLSSSAAEPLHRERLSSAGFAGRFPLLLPANHTGIDSHVAGRVSQWRTMSHNHFGEYTGHSWAGRATTRDNSEIPRIRSGLHLRVLRPSSLFATEASAHCWVPVPICPRGS